MEITFNTQVSCLAFLEELNISLFDEIYLGDPYCRRNPDYLNENLNLLAQAVDKLRKAGVKPLISTFAVPLTDDLDQIRKLGRFAVDNEIEALEAHNYGVMNILSKEFSKKFHVGVFANVYSSMTAEYVARMGAKRVQANHEVSFMELKAIAGNVPALDIQVTLFGKVQLGISDDCLLIEKDSKSVCPAACGEGYHLHASKWDLVSFGTLTTSAKEQCLLELVPALLDAGVKTFRIEGLGLKPETINHAAEICRTAVEKYISTGNQSLLAGAAAELSRSSKHGLCNGYLHSKPGHLYFSGAEIQDGGLFRK